MLIDAQALGDSQSLGAHGLPVLRVHLGDDPDAGLAELQARSSTPSPDARPRDRPRPRQRQEPSTMDLVIVGLGRMGANMARRLHRAGHRVVAFNRSPEKTHEIMAEGLEGAFTPEEVVAALPAPRIVWLMVPAGDATESTMEEFAALLSPGDTIVDGGNTNFQDSKRRHALLAARGIHFVDAGISGGVWGLQNGYGTMVGGDREAVAPLEPIFLVAGAGGRLHPLRARRVPATTPRWSTTASSTA